MHPFKTSPQKLSLDYKNMKFEPDHIFANNNFQNEISQIASLSSPLNVSQERIIQGK
jgi:hypothetical protein